MKGEIMKNINQKKIEYEKDMKSFSKGMIVLLLILSVFLVVMFNKYKSDNKINHNSTNETIKLIVSTNNNDLFPTYLASLEYPDKYIIDEKSIGSMESSINKYMSNQVYEMILTNYKGYRLNAYMANVDMNIVKYEEEEIDNEIIVNVIVLLNKEKYAVEFRTVEKDNKVVDLEIINDAGLLDALKK